jgi:hypothetical protein
MAEYRILIENKTADEGAPVSTSPNGENIPEAVPADKGGKDSENGGGKLAQVMVATNVIKPYIQQAVSFSVSQIEMESGSASLQRRAEAFGGAASSVGGIVAAGIMGGPSAAVVAGATMLVQKIVQAEFQRMAIANQKRMEQESISLQRSRLGLSANRSRGGGVV